MQNYNIFLTKEEAKIFDKFSNADAVVLSAHEFEILRKYGFVEGTLDGKSDWFDIPSQGVCHISDRGKHFREFSLLEKRNNRNNSVRYWVPIAIDFLLSIAAITISIIALMQG